MQMNAPDLTGLNDTFTELASRLIEAVPADPAQQDQANSPSLLAEAMQKVFDLLRIIQKTDSTEAGQAADEPNLHTLGDYGFNLLADLTYGFLDPRIRYPLHSGSHVRAALSAPWNPSSMRSPVRPIRSGNQLPWNNSMN